MLTIIYGDAPQSIYNTNVYFKNTYESEWFESGLQKIWFGQWNISFLRLRMQDNR